jgi:hypothetical protein
MKKILGFVTTTLVLLNLFSPGALAATPAQPTTPYQHKALDVLNTLDTWMHEKNDSGIAYINDTLKTGLSKAKVWDQSARLQEFFLDFKPNDHLNCNFTFSAVNVTDKIAKSACPLENAEITATTESTTAKTSGIYSLSLRLRDLVPKLKEDPTFISLLKTGLLGDPQNSDINSTFRLAKNSANKTTWEVTLTDSTSGKSLIIKTGTDTQTPAFTYQTGK